MNNASTTLIKQVRVINPVGYRERILDVLIADNKVKAISPHIEEFPQKTKIIDNQKLVLGPGLVDIYSHSGEPGHEYRENLSSLMAAAAAGGFTCIGILPDTIPPVDNLGILLSLQQQKQQFKQTLGSLPSLKFWGALTKNLKGTQMTELAELASSVIGFADGYSIEDFGLLRQILEYLQPLDKPIGLVVTSSKLKGKGVIREGVASIRYGLPGSPGFAEAVAIASIIEMVDAIGTPVHLMRVSTGRGVELIAHAKQRGIPITASTTWMHLLYNTNDLADYNPNLRLEPPLGNEEDMQALIDGVKQGVIDAIAIDHTPYTYEEKTLAFADSPPGVIGLELALPILWQRFVASGEWSAIELWQALSTRPQLCLGKQPKEILPETSTEMILFDPQIKWLVNKQNLQSQSENTPWWHKEITGRVVNIWTPD